MFEIDKNNLHKVAKQKHTLGLSEQEIQNCSYTFSDIDQQLQTRNQGWIDYPYNRSNTVFELKKFAEEIKNKYEYIVLLGIGGSMLGPKCIIDCLYTQNSPKFLFVDNIDPQLLYNIENQIDYSKTLFLVQTKSGTTPETIAQYLYFSEKIETQNLKTGDHFVFVTEEKDSFLRKIATQENIKTFSLPENIGGRFSALTPIGLLSAAIAGLDLEKFIKGAINSLESKEEAFELAKMQLLLSQKGQKNLVIMPYSSSLKTLAEWCVQLYSESLGKEVNNKGEIINTGITPLAASGVTDQHSQIQLFKEGPFDKQILFIEIEDYIQKQQIPTEKIENEVNFDYFKNTTFEDLIKAEFLGTKQSLTESNRSNITLKINRIDEYSLGGLFMLFQLVVAYIGEMMDINTFNQPGVERAKIITKEILSKQNQVTD